MNSGGRRGCLTCENLTIFRNHVVIHVIVVPPAVDEKGAKTASPATVPDHFVIGRALGKLERHVWQRVSPEERKERGTGGDIVGHSLENLRECHRAGGDDGILLALH